MSEDDLLRLVLDLARLLGWRTLHIRPARTYLGWRTPVQGDGKGFPDLVLVRRGRLVFAELKSDTGELTFEQQLWLDALRATGPHAETYLWRPSDWRDGDIEAILRREE